MRVYLRQRKQTKKGKISLYLEIYKGTIRTQEGKVKKLQEYEYLDLYLIDNPKTQSEKQSNKDTLELAHGIKAKRELEIKNGLYGFRNDFKQKANFIDYFSKLMVQRLDSKGNYGNWNSTLKHLKSFAGEKVSFREIDVNFCERFRDYLTDGVKTKSGNPLSTSAVNSYFNKFRACLKDAVKENIILSNPATDIRLPKIAEHKREFLTLEELKKLVKTECRYPVLKRAFIFACLTGLRWSDIQKLVWSEVQETDDGWRITFHQKKTKGLQYLDISVQAYGFLGERTAPDDRVFLGLKYSAYLNVALQRWVLDAGITKTITFHCARHTFAVMQLDLGTELFTLQKLLGHAEIRTTQVYSQIMDKKKKEAVNKIPDINI